MGLTGLWELGGGGGAKPSIQSGARIHRHGFVAVLAQPPIAIVNFICDSARCH